MNIATNELNLKLQKVIELNADLKNSLGVFGNDKCEANYTLHNMLGLLGIEEWRLCAAYIDWFIEVWGGSQRFTRLEKVIIDVLDDFLKRYHEKSANFELFKTIKNFDQLLCLLSMMRLQFLDTHTHHIKTSDLEDEIQTRIRGLQ